MILRHRMVCVYTDGMNYKLHDCMVCGKAFVFHWKTTIKGHRADQKPVAKWERDVLVEP